MTKFSKMFLGLIFISGVLLFAPFLAEAALSFTVAPAAANVDNLINQSNATWRFTINNDTALSTTTTAVAITFPSDVQGWNFVNMTASSTALGGDLLRFSTTPPDALPAVQGNTIIIMASTSQTSVANNFIIDIKGVGNPLGELALLIGNHTWSVKTCVLNTPGNPSLGCGADFDSAANALASLARRGGLIDEWSFTASNYSVGGTGEYTITFKASTTLNVGEKIWVNFPVGFNITNATTSNQTISGATTINSTIVATTTSYGLNAVIATTSAATIAALATVTFKIGGITNPAIGSYMGLRVFTTTANNGLVDGSMYGDFGTDAGFFNRPPPVDSIQIGGTNTILGRAKVRQASGVLRDLNAGEIAQIRVGMGCPDKMFFVGTKRLDANGGFSYGNLLNATYVLGIMPDNISDENFFDSYLQPNRIMINVTGNEIASSSPIFETPDGVIEGTITGGPTGVITNVAVRAYTDASESFSPMFTDANYNTMGLTNGTGYFQARVKTGQTWNLSFLTTNSTTLTSGGTQYWTPSASPIFIDPGKPTTTPAAYSFVVADKTLNVTLRKGSDNSVIDASVNPRPCVSIRRAGSEIMGPGGSGTGVCSTTDVGGVNVYQLKVPTGAFSIQGMLPGAGFKEYPITVLSTDTTVNQTIVISRPTGYIIGKITDPSSFAMQGVSVMAQGSNGSFNQTLSTTTGYYMLYVEPGTYRVEAFAPGYGPLTALTNVTVTTGANATGQNFLISAGSFKKIQGRVYTTAGDIPYEGVNIHAYGASGSNSSQSRNDGTYTLMVPAGTGYTVEAWSKDFGYVGTRNNVDASSDNPGEDFTVAVQGSLQITVTNGNAYGLSEIFARAYSTTTTKGTGSNIWTATSSNADLVTKFSLPAGYYKIEVGTPGFGNLASLPTNSAASSTAITANATKKLTIALPDMATLNGTAVANATVWASRTDGPGKYNTTANSSTGVYSMKIPTGYSYMVGASLPGYINAPVATSSFGGGTLNLTLTASAYNISGTLSSSAGGTASEGFVWATKAGNNGWVGSEISASGAYSLGVDSGTWTVYANAPCHTSSNGMSQTGSGTVNITLTIQSNCGYQAPTMQSIVPTTGGSIATSSISINIPPNALGTGSSNVSFSVAKPDTVPPSTLNATPISNSARSISVSDSNGTAVTTLSNSIEISITYSESDIPAGSSENNLQLAYWNTTTNTWDTVAATLDTVNNTLTGQVSHLSDFAPIIPTSEGAPTTPTGLAVTRSGNTGMSLSWIAVTGATGYLLYRDTSASGSFPYLTTKTSISHSDTGLSANTTYYYKVTASNASGESAASSAQSATTCSSVANGTVTGSACALTCNSGYALRDNNTSCATIGGGGIISGGGGAIAPVIPSQVPTTPATVVPTQIAQAPITIIVPSAIVVSVSPVFTKILKFGATSLDIKRLQQILHSDSDTKVASSGVGAPGKETNYFGSLTRKAVQKFQCKHKIVCSGTPTTTGYGNFGPKTRAKIQEVFKGQ